MELSFDGLEMQRWNIPTDGAQRADKKNGFICPVVMFTARAIVSKMSKMTQILEFFAEDSKRLVIEQNF